MRLLLLVLFQVGSVANSSDCDFEETISWDSGTNLVTRTVEQSTCKSMQNEFHIDQLLHKKASIDIQITCSGDILDSIYIAPTEIGVGKDGIRRQFLRQKLEGVGDTVVSSPSTSFYLNVIGAPNKSPLIFNITLEDDGCPYPFLESHLGSPLILPSNILVEECDFSVTAVDMGTSIEVTSIDMPIHHRNDSVAFKIHDGHDTYRWKEWEQSEFAGVRNVNLGTSKATFHTHDVAFITINSIIDTCTCPKGNILNDTYDEFFWNMEKLHCFHMNCSVNVQLAEHMRSKYRLAVWIYYHGEAAIEHVFGIQDGDNDIFRQGFEHRIAVESNRTYMGEYEALYLISTEDKHAYSRHLVNASHLKIFSLGEQESNKVNHHSVILYHRNHLDNEFAGRPRKPYFYTIHLSSHDRSVTDDRDAKINTKSGGNESPTPTPAASSNFILAVLFCSAIIAPIAVGMVYKKQIITNINRIFRSHSSATFTRYECQVEDDVSLNPFSRH